MEEAGPMAMKAQREDHASFMARFKNEPEHVQDFIEHAYIIGKDAHRAQTRKQGGRYWEHPRGVALILVDELGVREQDDVAASCLHDTVEDTKYITVKKIGRWWNLHVADLVDTLTKKRGQSLDDYYAAIEDWPEAAVIKGCDRLHNLRTLDQCDEAFVRKQVRETRERVLPALQHNIGQSWHSTRLQRLVNLIEAELVKLDHWLAGGRHWAEYQI